MAAVPIYGSSHRRSANEPNRPFDDLNSSVDDSNRLVHTQAPRSDDLETHTEVHIALSVVGAIRYARMASDTIHYELHGVAAFESPSVLEPGAPTDSARSNLH